jgi:excinuclease ABC subunit B
MAEELAKYLTKVNIRCRYIHSDIDTLERLKSCKTYEKDYLMFWLGYLLREGLDLPEVSLVILDADKEGFT